MLKNTFTVKARRIGQDTEIIKEVTTIMSNLGGFLISTKNDGQFQWPPDTIIIIDGSDDHEI